MVLSGAIDLHTHESTSHWCSAPIHHDCLAVFRRHFVQSHGKQGRILRVYSATVELQLQSTPRMNRRMLGPLNFLAPYLLLGLQLPFNFRCLSLCLSFLRSFFTTLEWHLIGTYHHHSAFHINSTT